MFYLQIILNFNAGGYWHETKQADKIINKQQSQSGQSIL